MSRTFAALWVAGVIAAVLAATVTLDNAGQEEPIAVVAVAVAIGFAYLLTGTIALQRRPGSLVGPLMVATAFAWFAGSLATSGRPLLFTLGVLFSSVFLALLAQATIAFPTGRPQNREQRVLITAIWILATVGQLVALLVVDPRAEDGCEGCPENLLYTNANETLRSIVDVAVLIAAVVICFAAAVSVTRRRRRAAPALRRVLAPVYWPSVTVFVVIGLSQVSRWVPDAVATVAQTALLVMVAILPISLLVAQLRAQLYRAAAVDRLVEDLQAGPSGEDLREAVARALRDPSVEIAYWLPDREVYVAVDGSETTLPAPGGRRSTAPVERGGVLIAQLVHDEAVREDPPLLDAVCGAAAVAIERDRLDAQLRAHVAELRASRQRLLEVGAVERRRLEHDLRDGARRRLESLAAAIAEAQETLAADPERAGVVIDGAGEELAIALAELRDLARGIHPAVLSDRGLAPALDALAARTPLEVELDVDLPGRLPERVEATAYLVAAETIDELRRGGATRARVRASTLGSRATIEVEGDVHAKDCAPPGAAGLADRVLALDGHLERVLLPTGGAIVRAELPCG